MNWDRRIPELEKQKLTLPNPIEEHVAESCWQTCDCRTCQEKRLTYDLLPGKKIDWSRFEKGKYYAGCQ
jgi:hypothetical protein